MPGPGKTRSGRRKQLPFTGDENSGAMGEADRYPPRDDCIYGEPQVRYLLDSYDWDAAKRDRDLDDSY
jgi:hypothetical protein